MVNCDPFESWSLSLCDLRSISWRASLKSFSDHPSEGYFSPVIGVNSELATEALKRFHVRNKSYKYT